MLPQTSATIPYHPGLMLGNVVEDCDMLSKLEDLANAQKEVDNSQYRLDKSLLSKYRLEMILADLRSLLPDENMLKIQHQIDAINEDITSIAIALANASVNESEIDRGDGNVEHAHQKVESPIDFDQSAIRQNLLPSDSMNMNCQYIRNDTSSLDSNHSHHPSSVANAVSFSVSSILSPKYASRMSAKVKAATWSQINLHRIEGTVVITVNCVHKMADTISPFVLDIEKAIAAWNTVNEDDKLKIDEIDDDYINNTSGETKVPSSSATHNQQQDTYMKVINGQILGSSFVGLIHVLRNKSMSSGAKSSNAGRNLDVSFGAVNLTSENESNYFVSKNSGVRFDYGASFANKLNSHFTAESLQSHCCIITLGFEGGVSDSTAAQKEVSENSRPTNSSKRGDVKIPSSPLSHLEKKVSPDVVLTFPVADKQPSGDINYKNMVERDFLMATLDDFIVKAGEGCGGVPIQFFLKPISKQMLVEEYLKTKKVNDDSSSYLPARKSEKPGMKDLFRSPSDYFPKVRRGQSSNLETGWNMEVTSRKEREEALREEAHQFELRLEKIANVLEQGIEVKMWQMNRTMEFGSEFKDDHFTLLGSQVHLKLDSRGEFLVQAALTFSMKGGYLQKASNRQSVDKSALEPLSIMEILDVKAGCEGYDHNQLPSSTRRTEKREPNHSSHFITLKASPTPPLATSRLYFLKFESRDTRNDLLFGLRSLLADLQVNEGVGISTIQAPEIKSRGNTLGSPLRSRPGDQTSRYINPENALVPLSEVHKAIDDERRAYDRLLLMMLQGTGDLKATEDDISALLGKLDVVMADSKEKDRIHANDSKLIMQMTKKLESLIMENGDLRDQNGNLNYRIVALENEKLGEYET